MTTNPPPPEDLVRPRGLSVAALDALAGQAGLADVEITEPGRVVLDVNGDPIAVEPARRTRGTLGSVVVTRRDLDALGVTPDDAARRWPRLRVVEP